MVALGRLVVKMWPGLRELFMAVGFASLRLKAWGGGMFIVGTTPGTCIVQVFFDSLHEGFESPF